MRKPARPTKPKAHGATDAARKRRVLTVKFIETRKGKAKEYEEPDSGAQGLRLLVQPSGHKSWAVRFRRPDGKPAKLTLGPFLTGNDFHGEPEIGAPLTLAAARLLCAKIQRERQLGTDVISQRKEARLKQRIQARTDAESGFADFARLFMDEHAKPKTRRWIETARNLGLQFDETEAKREIDGEPNVERLRRIWPVTKAGLAERWSNRPARSIDLAAIKAVVSEAEKGIPGVSVRRKGKSEARKRALRSALSSMFAWLAKEQDDRVHPYLDVNPLAGRKGIEPPAARDRVLTDDEVRWFWAACDSADAPRIPNAPRPYGPALKLLLLTGARLNEIAKMQRHELQNGDLHLESNRTKNARPHIVPLAPQARDLIPTGDRYVFSTTGGAAPISSWSKTKRRLDEKMLELARKERGDNFIIPPWRVHDLRRTAVTGMRRLKISSDVVEAVVNHVSGFRAGVAGTYDRHALMDERREALERWATHVIGLASGGTDNVVPIAKAKPRRAKR